MKIWTLISVIIFTLGIFTGIIIKVEVDKDQFGNEEITRIDK